MKEWNPRRSHHHVLLITSSRIPLSRISVTEKVICILKGVHHEVVGHIGHKYYFSNFCKVMHSRLQ